ncbi:hydroxyisourate hydrolase [Paracoccus methylarcula]|uniref:5-hydroxyisourate hydrolase n=1 Tax=Paracoccus methylarcula TaxID=72022 RepID=A0A422QWK4_9RHOB|nr:hydroxyisourate hydrolase [Paracoccus methylarcula]RNF34349.1 hydroxyisourate hydrolase [Paracoccus methylarcula]
MAGITTHVLDNETGSPGVGMRIDFSVFENGEYRLLKTVQTNQEGRTDEMILTPEETRIGQYQLLFHVDEYYRSKGTDLPEPPFIEKVPVNFSVFDTGQHYHVPMLCTPWTCTTYRGS